MPKLVCPKNEDKGNERDEIHKLRADGSVQQLIKGRTSWESSDM